MGTMWPSCLWRAAINRWLSCLYSRLVILYVGSGSCPLLIPCGSGPASFPVTFPVHQRAGFKCWMSAKRMSWHHPFHWASGKKENPAPTVLSLEVVPGCAIGTVSREQPVDLLATNLSEFVSAGFMPLLGLCCQWKRRCLRRGACSRVTVLHGIHGVCGLVVYSLLRGGTKWVHSFPNHRSIMKELW